MAAFLATLEPIDVVFLATAVMIVLDFLAWAVWQSLKNGVQGGHEPLAFSGQPPGRVSKVFQMMLGFTMTFSVAGLALRGLAGAEPLWALLGALAAGVMAGVLVWGMDEKRDF